MEDVPSRIGYCVGNRVRSVRIHPRLQQMSGIGAMKTIELIGDTEQEVKEWFQQQPSVEEDRNQIVHFYRCMEEGTEFYYLYESSTGWQCGGVTWNTPLRGRIVPVKEARDEMEKWIEDLKYLVNEGGR